MLPAMAASMSASLGLGVVASRAEADMICPDWQYPHCGTSSSSQACCTGWLRSFDNPSMVVMDWSPTALIGVWQERTAWPPRCTVQAPHKAMPQPNYVPVSPTTSRSPHTKGISGPTSTSTDLPLMLSLVMAANISRTDAGRRLKSALRYHCAPNRVP